MDEATLLQDLAVVMTAAGIAALLAQLLDQPKALAYMAAGVVIGPFTPPFSFVQSESAIHTLADLGILFLMFSLGLEFNLRRLRSAGRTAFITASLDVALMLYLGYHLGRRLGWGDLESIFLGAIICDSSTTVLAKVLRELNKSHEKFAPIVYATTLVEDLLAVGLIAVLTSLGTGGGVHAGALVTRAATLAVFLIVMLVGGLLVVPRLLRRVAGYRSDELLTIVVLALAFGVSLLAVKLQLSLALGAFLVGAITAESRLIGRIELLVAPMRHMLTAVFFVAIGMLIQPQIMIHYATPIIGLAAVIVVAKLANCFAGCFLSGHDMDTSFRVGIAMGQVGEFAFIIAALGLSLGTVRPDIYQVGVGAAILSILVNPYMIRRSDRLAQAAERLMPASVRQTMGVYTRWIHQLNEGYAVNPLRSVVGHSLRLLVINSAFIAALFMGAGYLARREDVLAGLGLQPGDWRGLLWLPALLLALPFYVANFRKLQALGMILGEVTIPPSNQTRWAQRLRAFVAALTLFIGVAAMAWLTFLVSSAFLPSPRALIVLLALAAVVTALSWQFLVRVYARAQSEVRDLFAREAPASSPASVAGTIGALLDGDVAAVTVPRGSPVIGKSLPQLRLRSVTGATVVSIERAADVVFNPDSSQLLEAGDRILLLGSREQVEAVRQMFAPKH